MKRLFAAIKISPEQTFQQIYWNLRGQLKNEKIKWVDLQNIHITLKFFGETPDSRIPDIVHVLDEIQQKFQPFNITLNGVGIFGSSYKPRVIWFGIKENKALMDLGLNVLESADNIGFERDRQNFRPHLTIGRIKYIEDKRSLNKVIEPYRDLKIQESEVTEMHLYESILQPSGPVYKVIQSFSLQ